MNRETRRFIGWLILVLLSGGFISALIWADGLKRALISIAIGAVIAVLLLIAMILLDD